MTASDRAAVVKALALPDVNPRHPSLQVHALQGKMTGTLTAYVTRSLRLRYRVLSNGRKELIDCTKHYDD
jgi:mRNA-degrading endonuclease YafQ of YafQ-DinJ toxin-antitoxin module